MSIVERLQKKAKSICELFLETKINFEKWKKAGLNDYPDDYPELNVLFREKWIKLNDVTQLLEKINEILNHEYPPNWSPCAVAMTRLRRLRELLKE